MSLGLHLGNTGDLADRYSPSVFKLFSTTITCSPCWYYTYEVLHTRSSIILSLQQMFENSIDTEFHCVLIDLDIIFQD